MTPSATVPFFDRLATAVKACGNPVCAGLDPRANLLPASMVPAADAGPQTIAAAYGRFCRELLDVLAGRVPVVKPQAAFFEELGPVGMQVLAETVAYARTKGLLVILDGKRHDIGSTAEAYAAGYLGADSPWRADCLTVGPYLGDDSLDPFLEVACRRGAGIFILVKTSNPGGKLFQDLLCDGEPLYRHVGRYVERVAAATAGASGYGTAGSVVGATHPDQLAELRALMPHSWILAPGYGSQGASARDVAAGFDANGLGAVVNNSRALSFAYTRPPYKERFGHDRWQDAVSAALDDMISELRTHTPAGKLA